MPQPLLGARDAIRIALDAEGRSDVESTWSAAGPGARRSGLGRRKGLRRRSHGAGRASPERVFDVLTRLGGKDGWFRYNRLWRLRGVLDRFVGGPGWQRRRRHPDQLSWGEPLGFWRVSEIERGRRLTLRAEMRVPGVAVLDFELSPASMPNGAAATMLTQTARFRPKGLLGLLYWYVVLPFHGPVFDGLFNGIRRAATVADAPPVITVSEPTPLVRPL